MKVIKCFLIICAFYAEAVFAVEPNWTELVAANNNYQHWMKYSATRDVEIYAQYAQNKGIYYQIGRTNASSDEYWKLNIVEDRQMNFNAAGTAFTAVSVRKLMSPGSNKEFAILHRPLGAVNYQWMPAHGGVNTVFKTPARAPELVRDGAIIGFDTVFKKFKDFSYISDYSVTHPENTSPTATVRQTVALIDKRLRFWNEITASQTIEIRDGYSLMMPIDPQFAQSVTFANNTVFALTTNTTLPSYSVTLPVQASNSYLFKNVNSEVALAVTVLNPAETYRLGRTCVKGNGATMNWAWFVLNSYTKIYSQVYQNCTLSVGHKLVSHYDLNAGFGSGL